jgi:hypothetical protein
MVLVCHQRYAIPFALCIIRLCQDEDEFIHLQFFSSLDSEEMSILPTCDQHTIQ